MKITSGVDRENRDEGGKGNFPSIPSQSMNDVTDQSFTTVGFVVGEVEQII